MRITREEFRSKPATHWLDVSRTEPVIVTENGVDRIVIATPRVTDKEETKP